jgi:uncharacterized membrane protein
MTDPTPAGSAPSSNRAVMIVLSYLWILALVPYLTEKNDPEVQWHSKHGLVLFGAEIIVWIAAVIVRIIIAFTHIPFIGCFISLIWFLLFIGILILHVMCIIKGVNGQRLTVPVISEFADKF